MLPPIPLNKVRPYWTAALVYKELNDEYNNDVVRYLHMINAKNQKGKCNVAFRHVKITKEGLRNFNEDDAWKYLEESVKKSCAAELLKFMFTDPTIKNKLKSYYAKLGSFEKYKKLEFIKTMRLYKGRAKDIELFLDAIGVEMLPGIESMSENVSIPDTPIAPKTSATNKSPQP